MVAPFNQAWVLLKQRGHELNLPPPRIMGDNPARSLSPQDLTDRRVNRASAQHHTLDDFEGMATQMPRIANINDARRHLEDNQGNQRALANALEVAERQQAQEAHFERLQGDLDRQTLARMGQQPEADEIEAMGVPPMSRTLSATPPPNIGRAGSSDTDVNQREPPNPFPKPLGENVRGDLMDWAAGAGRRGTGKPAMPEKIYPEEMMEEPLEGFHNSPAPAGESAPTPMDIPNTVTTSPRMSRKNRPGESAPTPRLEGRAQRKGLPFSSPYKQ